MSAVCTFTFAVVMLPASSKSSTNRVMWVSCRSMTSLVLPGTLPYESAMLVGFQSRRREASGHTHAVTHVRDAVLFKQVGPVCLNSRGNNPFWACRRSVAYRTPHRHPTRDCV